MLPYKSDHEKPIYRKYLLTSVASKQSLVTVSKDAAVKFSSHRLEQTQDKLLPFKSNFSNAPKYLNIHVKELILYVLASTKN